MPPQTKSGDLAPTVRPFLENELLERVIPFWERHSVDRVHGGYYNCLDRDGSRYAGTKYVWLQGRQAWMFAKLYRTIDPRPAWLEVSRLGIEFLRRHAVRPDGRVYFALTEDGRPVHIQRKVFGECFTAMALAEYGRAAGQPDLVEEAFRAFEQIWIWAFDPVLLGRPLLEGQPPLQPLAVPMILLNLIEELTDGEERLLSRYNREVEQCIASLLRHVDVENRLVREFVLPDGSALDTPEGRLLNPGHAIEAGWFLHHWGARLGRSDLRSVALDMIRWSFDRGWDSQEGGLYYFLDTGGYSPTQLEWFMKLWWPHSEALYALLLAHLETGDSSDLERFERTLDYVRLHLVDPEFPEWFGYLDRSGKPTHRFKGGPYKGCFHVPRALWLCLRALPG